jgi:hypothetical protein
MVKSPKKNPESKTDNASIATNEKETLDSKISEEIEHLIDSGSDKMPEDAKIVDLLATFNKMKTEEQRLLGLKHQMLTQQNELQNTLIKEIEKKKAAIATLVSEIPDLQKENQKLGELLGIDIYK